MSESCQLRVGDVGLRGAQGGDDGACIGYREHRVGVAVEHPGRNVSDAGGERAEVVRWQSRDQAYWWQRIWEA